MADKSVCPSGGFEEVFVEENMNIKKEEVDDHFLDDTNEIPCGVLADHKEVQTLERPFECDFCTKSFPSPSVLALHIKTHKNPKIRQKATTCDVCQKSFSSSTNLQRHKMIHTGEKLYQCDQCDKSYNSHSRLTVHKRIHTGEKPYKCNHCDRSFRESTKLTLHIRMHTGEKPHQCEHCNKCFSRPANLLVHKRTHTGEKPYSCDQCDKSFIVLHHLKQHKRIHTGEKPHPCDQCDKSFSTRFGLTVHKRMHTGEKPYQCDQCHLSFRQSSKLTLHKRIHTGVTPCQGEGDQSEESFISYWNLIQKRIHTGGKSYECGQCEMSFISASMLAVHNRIHIGQKPYQCDYCKKSFRLSSELTVHERIHTRPYQCDQCNKSFVSVRKLATHKRIHTGGRPNQYDPCPQAFIDPASSRFETLKVNEERHQGELNAGSLIRCPLCDEKFKATQDRRNHIMLHHDSCKCEFSESEPREICVSKPTKCTKCEKNVSSKSPFRAVIKPNEGSSFDQLEPLQNSDGAVDSKRDESAWMSSGLKAVDDVLEAADAVLQKVKKEELDYD